MRMWQMAAPAPAQLPQVVLPLPSQTSQRLVLLFVSTQVGPLLVRIGADFCTMALWRAKADAPKQRPPQAASSATCSPMQRRGCLPPV